MNTQKAWTLFGVRSETSPAATRPSKFLHDPAAKNACRWAPLLLLLTSLPAIAGAPGGGESKIGGGLYSLIIQSGTVAKIILLLLLLASIASWSLVLSKWFLLRRALNENRKFLDTFWAGKSIDEIFTQSDRFPSSPVALVFKSGVKELRKVSPQELCLENITRSLSRSSQAEITHLEKNVSWLATIASAAPFVGLFGTVWGIMNSFQGIGASGSANLAVVAPGISEALITTAMGIGAAIPAVIAYNHFAGQIRKVAVDIECFSQDFLNIVQRNLPKRGDRT